MSISESFELNIGESTSSIALQDCISMVIYKVIDIEELECIKRSMHCNGAINEIGILVGRHEMGSSIDTIEMNDCNVRLTSVSTEIWLY